MTPNQLSTGQISQEFDLLSLKCTADLVTGEEFRARRKALYEQIVNDAARRAEQNIADTSWYPVEVTA